MFSMIFVMDLKSVAVLRVDDSAYFFMAKNEENWLANYEALKAHVLETGHFLNKHDKHLNWAKFQMKKVKAGMLDPERQRLFVELMAMRSGQHTGGRKKKE